MRDAPPGLAAQRCLAPLAALWRHRLRRGSLLPSPPARSESRPLTRWGTTVVLAPPQARRLAPSHPSPPAINARRPARRVGLFALGGAGFEPLVRRGTRSRVWHLRAAHSRRHADCGRGVPPAAPNPASRSRGNPALVARRRRLRGAGSVPGAACRAVALSVRCAPRRRVRRRAVRRPGGGRTGRRSRHQRAG